MLLFVEILHNNIYFKKWIKSQKKILLNKTNIIFPLFGFKGYRMWFGTVWRQVHILSGNGIWCHALLEFVLTISRTHTEVSAITHIFSAPVKNEWMNAMPFRRKLSSILQRDIQYIMLQFHFAFYHVIFQRGRNRNSAINQPWNTQSSVSRFGGRQWNASRMQSGISRRPRIGFREFFFCANPLLDTA